eukprot:Pgem_evm1s12385
MENLNRIQDIGNFTFNSNDFFRAIDTALYVRKDVALVKLLLLDMFKCGFEVTKMDNENKRLLQSALPHPDLSEVTAVTDSLEWEKMALLLNQQTNPEEKNELMNDIDYYRVVKNLAENSDYDNALKTFKVMDKHGKTKPGALYDEVMTQCLQIGIKKCL